MPRSTPLAALAPVLHLVVSTAGAGADGPLALRTHDLSAPDLPDLGRVLLLQAEYLRLIGAVDPGVAKGEDNARLRAAVFTAAVTGQIPLEAMQP